MVGAEANSEGKVGIVMLIQHKFKIFVRRKYEYLEKDDFS